MKKFLFSFFILFIHFYSNAQNIVFADPNFKNRVVLFYDQNFDNELSYTEASSIGMLDLGYANITNLEGIQFFTNVNSLNCSHNSISAFNFSLLNSSISEIDFSYNNLSSLNLQGTFNNLTTLNLSHNLLSSFELSFFVSISSDSSLDLSYNNINSLNFMSLNHNVGFIDISYNNFATLDLTGLTTGSAFVCNNNPNLTSVKIPSGVFFTEQFSISNSPNLTLVDFQNDSCDFSFGLSGIPSTGILSGGFTRWTFSNNNPNLVFKVDCLSCGQPENPRTEQFGFSHLNIIYSDSTIPLSAPDTNNTTPDCSLENNSTSLVEIFDMYPNPADNNLNIDLKEPQNILLIKIYNTLGQLVVSYKKVKTIDKTISVDISNLKIGIYFLSIEADKRKTIKRFIKK